MWVLPYCPCCLGPSPRCPHVMTTTLCVIAQELQVSIMVEQIKPARCGGLEQQGRIVPANKRYSAGEALTRSSEGRDRSRHHSVHRGGLELSTGRRLYVGVGRPRVVWLCGL